MKEFDLAGFASHLAKLPLAVAHAQHEAMEHAARKVQAEAKSLIGNYQPDAGPFVAWAELADATKGDRLRRGFSENDPLLRTGHLRDSIEYQVSLGFEVGQVEAEVGSNSDIAVYQELGTSGGGWGGPIPPRSFLGIAAVHKSGEVVKICGGFVVSALSGQGRPLVGIP